MPGQKFFMQLRRWRANQGAGLVRAGLRGGGGTGEASCEGPAGVDSRVSRRPCLGQEFAGRSCRPVGGF